MNEAHVISDEVLDQVKIALSKGEHWMAYNRSLYFIDRDDVHFFNSKASAAEFADNNFSDYDSYAVMFVSSVSDVLQMVPHQDFARNQILHPDTNGLYNNEGNSFTDAYIDHIEHQQLLNNKNVNVMNEQNLDYLKGNIKMTGFGESFNEQLEKNLKEGKDDFQLAYKAEINKKPFEAVLTFRKSKETDMYFFNGYHASLQKSNGEKVEQNFNLNKGKGVTAKEAFNLLDGRSVHKQLINKEGVPYQAWLQLDFANKDKNNNFEVKQFHENYGYDLKVAVSKYAIAELTTPDKEKYLMESLQRGNVQSVTIDKAGGAEKMFIEANPQYKSVTLYDGQMKRVPKENAEQYHSKGEGVNTAAKQEQKEDVKKKDNKQDITKDTKQKNSLLPKKQNSNGLLEKKRTSTKKGLAMS